MANTLKLEIIVDDKGTPVVQKFADGTTAALGKVENASGSMGGSFQKSWAGIATGANQLIQVFGAVVDAAQAPILAYMESEKALLKMGMAMKNQGDFSREALSDLEDYAAEIQKTTAFEDDATLAVMGNLKSFGLSNDEVKKATKAALDFATAKANEGMTVEKASEMLGKAYLGNTTTLGKYGIKVDETLKGSEKFAAAMDQLNSRFGGSAQADLLTYAGQWKNIQNQWGDLQELLGFGFLKSIEAVTFRAGLLGTTFLTAGIAILGILRLITSPFTLLLTQFAKLADLAGLTGTAEELRAISSATEEAQRSVKSAREETIAWTAKQYDALTATDKVATAIDAMGIAGKRTQAIDEEATKKRIEATKSIEEAIRKNAFEIDAIGKSQYDKDVARIAAEVDKYKTAGVDKDKLNKFYLSEMEIATAKSYDEVRKVSKAAGDDAVAQLKLIEAEETKLMTQREKDAATYKALMSAEADFADTENKRAINKIIADHAAKITKLNELQEGGNLKYADYMALLAKYNANKDAAILEKETENASKIATLNANLINGIRGWEKAAYDARIAEIDAQAAKDLKDGADYEKVMAKKKADTETAFIAMSKASNSFTAGFSAGLLQMEKDSKSFGEAGYEIFNTLAESTQSAFSDLLFESIKSGTVDAKAVWDTFADAMLQKFTDILAQMVIEAAAKDIAMLFKASWTQDSSAILGIINKGWDLWNSIGSGGGNTDSLASIDLANGIEGRAGGGPVPAGKPVWVGEKGPELLFPGGPGYVMEHNQSMAYAAKNGGHIPGYAEGGWIDDIIAAGGRTMTNAFSTNDSGYAVDQFGNAAVSAWIPVDKYGWQTNPSDPQFGLGMPPGFLVNLKTDHWLLPGSVPNASTQGNPPIPRPGTSFISSLGEFISSIPVIGNIMDEWDRLLTNTSLAGYAIREVGGMTDAQELDFRHTIGLMAATWGIGGALGAGEAGAGVVGTAAEGGFTAEELALAYNSVNFGGEGALGIGGAGSTATAAWGAQIENAIFEYIQNLPQNYAKSYAKGIINNMLGSAFGGGSASYSFAGAEGDLSWLYDDMRQIAPTETPFSVTPFSAQNGLDYVPVDNFPILAHRGERVQTAGEASNLAKEMQEMRLALNKVVAQLKKQNRYSEEWTATGLLTRTS